MAQQHTFTATAGRGILPLLAKELAQIGVNNIRETTGSVQFKGALIDAYRVCLWSRLANSVLMPIARFDATTSDALYKGIYEMQWEDHLRTSEDTIAVQFNSFRSKIQHTQYGAQRVKDGIVDRFRDQTGTRPSVDLHQPDVRINVYVRHNSATVSIDLSGESLHKRGYRTEQTLAPLKENLAAAILYIAEWPQLAASGASLIDPMCGSGTLLIEAALMAADIAPGLSRDYFGFHYWKQHDKEIWSQLLAEAQRRKMAGLSRLPVIIGGDRDARAIKAATENIAQAGLADRIHLEHRGVSDWHTVDNLPQQGVVVTNPPYGERIGRELDLPALYGQLGRLITDELPAWRSCLITDDASLTNNMRLTQINRRPMDNGPIACEIINFYAPRKAKPTSSAEFKPVSPLAAPTSVWENAKVAAAPADVYQSPAPAKPVDTSELSEHSEMFANRLTKNSKHLRKWARKQPTTAYRVYDADLPEYAVAIDVYGDHVHVQEYAAPKEISVDKALARLDDVMALIPQVLGVPAENVALKLRQRQRGKQQYEAYGKQKKRFQVSEFDCDFWVNLTDYLDTGLFLDHRITRQRISKMAAGQDFLNLFAYTGAATVHAAAGSAKTTTTLDMSNTYLSWAQDNMTLNGFTGAAHQFVRANCLEWLLEAQKSDQRYGLIFLDPPTFSNSTRMEGVFDIQRDHIELLTQTANLLTEKGVLVFSTNRRDFKLDNAALPMLEITDVRRSTLPEDFKRNPKIHACWEIRQAAK